MCNECKFIWQHQTSQETNPLLSVSSVAQMLAPDLVGAPPNPQQSQGRAFFKFLPFLAQRKKKLHCCLNILFNLFICFVYFFLFFLETDAFWDDNDSDSTIATQDIDQLLQLLGLGDDRPVPEPVSWRDSDPLGSNAVPSVVSLGMLILDFFQWAIMFICSQYCII